MLIYHALFKITYIGVNRKEYYKSGIIPRLDSASLTRILSTFGVYKT